MSGSGDSNKVSSNAAWRTLGLMNDWLKHADGKSGDHARRDGYRCGAALQRDPVHPTEVQLGLLHAISGRSRTA